VGNNKTSSLVTMIAAIVMIVVTMIAATEVIKLSGDDSNDCNRSAATMIAATEVITVASITTTVIAAQRQ